MRVAPLLISAAVLSACGARTGEPVEPGPARDAQPPPASEAPAPLTARPTFAGRWAATPQLCRDGAWMFSETGVETAGETSCLWSAIVRTETGWTVAGRCTAEGTATEAQATLTQDGPDGLTVAGGPWDGPVELGRCGAG